MNPATSAATAVLEKLTEAKITPAKLARALGVSRQLGSLMLQGKRGIPIWHLDAIAALLKKSVPELFVSHPVIARNENASLNVRSHQSDIEAGRGADAPPTVTPRHDAAITDREAYALADTYTITDALRTIGELARYAETLVGTPTGPRTDAAPRHSRAAHKRRSAG